MKLIRCHIDNFGKLSDKDIEFNAGVNTILEDNGWGKSTLAAFIKVMLFGFDNEGRRDDYENERRRYNPWQKGPYGGTLTFELDGEGYVIYRNFGVKERDDTFEVRSARTNLPVDKFSDKTGQDILQIDSESFKKTVFISQNDCETSATDAINAKMGDISGATDDMLSYDKADAKFADMLNKLSLTRKTGDGWKASSEITELKSMALRKGAVESEYNKLMDRQADYKKEEEKLQQSVLTLQAEQAEINAAIDARLTLQKYDAIMQQYNERDAALKEARSAFPCGIPEEDKLMDMRRLASEISVKSAAVEYNSMSTDDENRLRIYTKKFADGIPTEDELNAVTQLTRKRSEYNNELISKKASCDALSRSYTEEMMRYEDDYSAASAGKGMAVALLITGAIVIIGAVAAGIVLSNMTVTMLLAFIGIAAVIGGSVLLAGVSVRQQRVNAARTARERVNPADELMKDIATIQNAIHDTDERVRDILNKYGETDADPNKSVYELKSAAADYAMLTEKKNAFIKSDAELADIIKNVKDYTASLGYVSESGLSETLEYIYESLQVYSNRLTEYNAAKDAVDRFKADNDIDALNIIRDKISRLRSTDEVESDIARIRTEIRELEITIKEQSARIETLEEELDNVYTAEETLLDKEEELDAIKAKVNHIKLAQEYLAKAKENFVSEYIGPMSDAFKKYSDMIYDGKLNYQFDVNSNLTVYEEGGLRNSRFFSAGYRDFMGLCTRLAFVDAMYKGEKPFLVLDDPFVNLDDTKTLGAKKFLEAVGKEYQIIYFTCHKGLTV